MKFLLLALLLFISELGASQNYNYVDKKYKITQAKELYLTYNTKIKPHFESRKLKYFTSYDGLQIAYKYFPAKNAKATIVISSGRTESMVKYPELIYDLNANGFSVYIHDHRGQGFSSRMTKDSQLGYVKDFFDYVKDMKYFVDNIVKHDKKLFLLAHSMGGEIASLYVQAHTDDFDAVVLSSPMHQPDLVVKFTTNLVCKVIESKVPKIPNYMIGETSYDKSQHLFETNQLTHSKLRFAITNEAYWLNPQTKVGGPSVNWVAQACIVSSIAIKNASQIKIPVLLIQAGQDSIVRLSPQEEFCKNVGANCRLIRIEGAYHELFVERDIYRNKALSAMFEFFNQNL